MPTRIVLSQEQVTELLAYLGQHLCQGACDHTRRLTMRWAQQNGIDVADLVDALEDSGGFCDCEVPMNVSPEAALSLSIPDIPTPPANFWCLPTAFQAPPADQLFTKILRAVNSERANCYSADGALLVSAPKGAKPRKRVRKSVHFFVGVSDGLPNELGFVSPSDGITSPAFARQVRDSGLPEFAKFTDREAAFFLSSLANYPPSTPVGSHFMEVTGVSAKEPDQLRIHKVIVHRK